MADLLNLKVLTATLLFLTDTSTSNWRTHSRQPIVVDKIDSTEYNLWENYYDYDAAIKNSQERIANNKQLKLIDENAKWINEIRDNETFSLIIMTIKSSLSLTNYKLNDLIKSQNTHPI